MIVPYKIIQQKFLRNKFGITILIFLFSGFSFCQNITITGKVFSYADNFDLTGLYASFNSSNYVIGNDSGRFSITVDKYLLKGPLILSYVGYRQVHVLNFPTDKDTVELGRIPLFDGFHTHLMVDYFCKWYDFKCRHDARRFYKKERAANKKHDSSVNKSIEGYRFIFRNKKYKFDYKNTFGELVVVLDLNKVVDEKF